MTITQKLGCLKINTILVISVLSCKIERHMSYQIWSCKIDRHMSYQITALPEFYEMEFQNRLSRLPWQPDNQDNWFWIFWNLPMFYLPFHSSYHGNNNYKYNFRFGAPDCQQTSLLSKWIPNVFIFQGFPWKYFIIRNDYEMPFAVKTTFTTGRTT